MCVCPCASPWLAFPPPWLPVNPRRRWRGSRGAVGMCTAGLLGPVSYATEKQIHSLGGLRRREARAAVPSPAGDVRPVQGWFSTIPRIRTQPGPRCWAVSSLHTVAPLPQPSRGQDEASRSSSDLFFLPDTALASPQPDKT